MNALSNEKRQHSGPKARIETRREGALIITETQGSRQSDTSVAAITREIGNASRTRLLIESGDSNGAVTTLRLNGAAARTLYRTLHKHYMRGDVSRDERITIPGLPRPVTDAEFELLQCYRDMQVELIADALGTTPEKLNKTVAHSIIRKLLGA